MPKYDGSGRALNNTATKFIAVSQTTLQISVSSDQAKDNDYIERIIINCPTSTATAATLFDGTNTVLAFVPLSAAPQANYVFDLGIMAQTTKGFNITTGSSCTVVVVGRWNNG